MPKYEYNLDTQNMWSSFDYGTVEADNYPEAMNKAHAELKEAFEKVNLALAHCDNTDGMTIEFDASQISLKEVK